MRHSTNNNYYVWSQGLQGKLSLGERDVSYRVAGITFGIYVELKTVVFSAHPDLAMLIPGACIYTSPALLLLYTAESPFG